MRDSHPTGDRIEGAGHLIQEDSPAQPADLIERWILAGEE